jgi:hypothetical protein
VTVTGVSSTFLIAAAVVVLVAIVLIVLLAVRARRRSDAAQALPGRVGRPSSPTAIVCSFCKREYDPAETGGRCPSCGAAAPRKG